MFWNNIWRIPDVIEGLSGLISKNTAVKSPKIFRELSIFIKVIYSLKNVKNEIVNLANFLRPGSNAHNFIILLIKALWNTFKKEYTVYSI